MTRKINLRINRLNNIRLLWLLPLFLFHGIEYISRCNSALAQENRGAHGTQPAEEFRLPDSGARVEREIGGDVPHHYLVTLRAGQYLRAVIKQIGIDVVVTLRAPNGEKLAEMDLQKGRGPEPVSFEATGAGAYRLEVRPFARAAAAGRYEISVETKPSASEQDGDRQSAERLTTQAHALLLTFTEENMRLAIGRWEQALALWRKIDDKEWEAYTLYFIGTTYNRLAEPHKALEAHFRSLSINKNLPDSAVRAATLLAIGAVYSFLGEIEQALGYYNEALVLTEATADLRQGGVLNNIGNVYARMGEYQKALEYYDKSLIFYRQTADRSREAATLNNIGKTYSLIPDYQKALEFHGRALAIRREIKERGGEYESLHNLGVVRAALGEGDTALDLFNKALRILRPSLTPVAEADTLYQIARVHRNLGRLAAARRNVDEALGMTEAVRMKIMGHGLRASYFATTQDYYELYVDVLMRLHERHPAGGYDAAALQANERARARGLLELLNEARADLRRGVDPLLLTRERELWKKIDAKAEQQIRPPGGALTEEEAADAAREMAALTAEREQLEAAIRRNSPRYAALAPSAPMTLAEIQRQLDPDTLLLEYALGESRSYLWAVTPTSVTSRELPGRAEIEKVAREVYESLGKIGSTPDAERIKAQTDLSRILLGPVATRLIGKRLIVVGDGILQYIPFAALPSPEGGGRPARTSGPGGSQINQRADLLAFRHEIVSLPSASTISALRRENAGRKPAAKTVAVLADPVFSPGDPRINSGAGGQHLNSLAPQAFTADAGLERSAREAGVLDFDRLRFSRVEADEITSLAPEEGGLKALDFRASRATATGGELGHYRIVHFATHGLLNSRNPELSGLVLSLVDELGRPQNGFLRLQDVYNLKLEADLVVLSGCQTALGKMVRGEGLIGLTRGFMFAGSPRVVASMWRVPDKPTAELMKHFYRGMLAEGLRPAAALRRAQIKMSRDERWSAPYFWAGFVLQGEWR